MAPRKLGVRGLITALTAVAFTATAGQTQAEVFTVKSKADSGKGTLRKALEKATATEETDTVKFAVEGTIALASELPVQGHPVKVKGPGVKDLAVSRAPEHAIRMIRFENPGDVPSALSNFTVKGFDAGLPGSGAIENTNGTLNLRSMAFKRNLAQFGAAVRNQAGSEVHISRSTFSKNSADQGGALINNHVMTVTDSTFTENGAGVIGGAIATYQTTGRLEVDGSTFTGNTASFRGAVSAESDVTITNSTFVGNGADTGGAFGVNNGVTPVNVLANNTFVGNYATRGSVFFQTGGPLVLRSNILAAPGEGPLCGYNGSIRPTSEGHNLITDSSCDEWADETGDQTSVADPGLKPLGDYGGFTQTVALKRSSPAVDKGNADTLLRDQRGLARIEDLPAVANAEGGDGSDIGAFEIQD